MNQTKDITALTRDQLTEKILGMLKEWLPQAPADEKLRLLFQLDAELYRLQGPASKEYEGGPHAKHRIIRYFDFFAERLSRGDLVLDVGCSDGDLSRSMAERSGANVVGIELDKAKINGANARNPHPNVTYIHGDVLKDLPEGTFDVVVMSNVLEHLSGRVEFLKRLQKTTGAARYLIRVPQYDREWRVPLKQELGMEWRLDTTHETEYTESQICEELRQAGLEITETVFKWAEIYLTARPAKQL